MPSPLLKLLNFLTATNESVVDEGLAEEDVESEGVGRTFRAL